MLTIDNLTEAAHILRCDLPAIRAVAEIESAGSGFLPDGQPRILFEAHVFSRLTEHKYDAQYPTISSRTWNRALYQGGVDEHIRLGMACTLDRDAGLKSASWGMFQIMGFNYGAAGFRTLQLFINAMYRTERDHLMAFVAFIQYMGLDDELRAHRWGAFAQGYNGPGFAQNKYDLKLAAAWAKYNAAS